MNNKIFKFQDLTLTKIDEWKENNKLVFTNGCFDVLHKGHLDYLIKAKELGTFLIVGLNSDISIKIIKGEGRPYNDEHTRALILASFLFVDAVILFNEETPLNLIKFIIPDVLVKGKDYKEENIVGYDTVIKNGGEVITIELTEGYSSTKTINKINGLYK